MPNHVTNIVSFSGKDAEKVALILSEDETFKFGFFPMPKELADTRSPANIVSAEEKAKENRGFGGRSITQEESGELIAKYGTNNWYDWACDNWGTKWSGYEGEQETPTRVKFQTAWSTPYPALVELSRQHPETTISVQYADEDFGCNVGEYVLLGGITVEKNQPDYGYSSLEMAFNILGETYRLDGICDLFEDNETGLQEFHEELDRDDYLVWMVDKIVETSYLSEDGDIPVFVLKYIETQAANSNNFEFAAEVKKRIDEIVA